MEIRILVKNKPDFKNEVKLHKFVEKQVSGLMTKHLKSNFYEYGENKFINYVTEAVWYKSRIFAKILLIKILIQDYNKSILIQRFSNDLQQMEVGQKIINGQYYQIYGFIYGNSSNSLSLEYADEDIITHNLFDSIILQAQNKFRIKF